MDLCIVIDFLILTAADLLVFVDLFITLSLAFSLFFAARARAVVLGQTMILLKAVHKVA